MVFLLRLMDRFDKTEIQTAIFRLNKRQIRTPRLQEKSVGIGSDYLRLARQPEPNTNFGITILPYGLALTAKL